jgi:hypothetical protein
MLEISEIETPTPAAPTKTRQQRRDDIYFEKRRAKYANYEAAPAPAPAPTKPEPFLRINNQKGRQNFWMGVHRAGRLTERQRKDLDALYQPVTKADVINITSLSAALASARIAPDEEAIERLSHEAHTQGDCQCAFPNLSNAPVLYRQCEQTSAF